MNKKNTCGNSFCTATHQGRWVTDWPSRNFRGLSHPNIHTSAACWTPRHAGHHRPRASFQKKKISTPPTISNTLGPLIFRPQSVPPQDSLICTCVCVSQKCVVGVFAKPPSYPVYIVLEITPTSLEHCELTDWPNMGGNKRERDGTQVLTQTFGTHTQQILWAGAENQKMEKEEEDDDRCRLHDRICESDWERAK